MKTATQPPVRVINPLLENVVRIFIGVLFIFSGLIKLNDPVGTKIKLEEYFEVFAADLPAAAGLFQALMPAALVLAVLMCVAEVVLGVALLIRYRTKLTLWALLGLVVFFTFLTFYSAWFNKVTDCGCFGDAIKLLPWQSFGKDVVLLILIGWLVVRYRKEPVRFTSRRSDLTMVLVTVACVGLGVYAIRYLPPIDFLPYRLGADLAALRKPSAPLQYKYIMEKNGAQQEFTEYPTDTTYTYKEMVLLNPEAKPKITDYSVFNSEGDFTEQTLSGNKLLLIVQDVQSASPESMRELAGLARQLKDTPVEVLVVTSSDAATFETYRHEYQLAVPTYFADATVLKTMIRTNPGLMQLQNGTVRGKWAAAALPSAEKIRGLLKE